MTSTILRRFASTFALMAVAACLFVPLATAQIPFNGAQSSVFPNYPVATITSLTATAQTSASFGMPGSAFGLIQVKATTLTTATWAIQGSIDGGVTFFPLPTTAVAGITTLPVTVAFTQTSTVPAGSLYMVNLAGITNVQFVTSSTFTATGLVIKLVTSSNKGLL